MNARPQFLLSSSKSHSTAAVVEERLVPLPPATTEDTPDTLQSAATAEVKPLYDSYCQADGQREAAGRQLGTVLLKWRATYKSQGNRTGGGFHALLKRLNIAKPTAYRWMRRVNPDFVSRDTKCESQTAKTPKRRPMAAGKLKRLFDYLESTISILDALENSGEVYKFGDTAEQCLHTARRLRSHLTHLVTLIQAEQRDRVQQVVRGTPKRAGIDPERTSRPRLVPSLPPAAANSPSGSGNASPVLLLSGHNGSPVEANDRCVEENAEIVQMHDYVENCGTSKLGPVLCAEQEPCL